MQPTPPKSSKPQYRRPFYDAGKKTSAEIIAEARTAVKPLDTSRPYTPAETSRKLFGTNLSRAVEGRPPSAFSIGANSFSLPGARSSTRPPSGKLVPLKRVPDIDDSVESFSTLGKHDMKGRYSSENLSKVQEWKERQTATTITSSNEMQIGYENVSKHDRRLSFPLPSESMEPSVTKSSRISSRQSMSRGRRVQSGPKEHSVERNINAFSSLKKSSSFGSFERDIATADSGVEHDFNDESSRPVSSDSNHVYGNSNPGPFTTQSNVTQSKTGNELSLDFDSLNIKRKDYKTSSRDTKRYQKIDRERSPDRQLNDNAHPNSSSSENESGGQNAYFKETIEPLLRQMELNYLHSDLDALNMNFDVLLKSLETCGLLDKIVGSGAARRRTQVLRTIFKFVEADNAEVILKMCKLALVMKVTGNNMVNICKLIFKISKDKSKDILFKELKMMYHILEILKTAEISLLYEGIIYATGSIKFLAASTILHEDFLQLNCIKHFVHFLSRIYQLAQTDTNLLQLSHLIVQASGAIRNIADIPNTRPLIVNSEIIPALIDLLQFYWKDSDYMLNVSRIFSKLTQYGDCCSIVCGKSNGIQLLLKALSYHHKKQDIVVRLVFILGNLAGKEPDVRSPMYFEHRSIDVLVDILYEYLEKCNKEKKQSTSDDYLEKANEVMMKTMRVIANLSIDSNVAIDITNNERCLQLITDILGNAKRNLADELLINSAATLNNLSYFATDESILNKNAEELTEALIQLLFIDNMDCIIEASRVFGNFTRSKNIRIQLRERKVVQMLITLLESTNREVVFCACGVLINLMVDNDNRKIMKRDGGIHKLIEALKDFGRTDWQLSCMVCQTLWNYSEKITSSVSCFGEEETNDLIHILQDYTDDEIALDYNENSEIDEGTKELMKQIWTEQFEQVGIRLLNRIESYHTELEPLVQDPN